MSSTVVGTHSGAGPLSLMSCVRESSPPNDFGTEYENDKNVAATKKKFWNPKKWFKRKQHHKIVDDGSSPVEVSEPNKEAVRSRSTSELSVADDTVKRRSSTSMHPGLSVSHDSVFHSPNSGSELELDNAQSTSSLSIPHPQQDLRFQSELSERLRSRRGRGDTSEDDEGLPHSPCNSPTTTEGPLEKTAIIKDHPTKSHSTCSDGSLLSMGSSEMDEDSFGQQSRHSSKLSLHEKRSSEADSDLELGLSNSSTPLNHSAAHHKVAVRPKRTHGVPRRKRTPQLSVNALPVTPEVNEDSSARSLTPVGAVSKEAITELYSSTTTSSSNSSTRVLLSETQIKCSSLPLGLVGPGDSSEANTLLSRSCSNAGSKSQEFSILGEEDGEDRGAEKSDKSFFDRIFPRRSGKKKKSGGNANAGKQEEKEKNNIPVLNTITTTHQHQAYTKHVESICTNKTTVVTTNKSVEKRPNVVAAAPRSGPASRQRVQPIDIPASPDLNARREDPKSSSPLEKCFSGTSPLQAELENHFRNRITTPSPTSPSPPIKNTVTTPSPTQASPELSPPSPLVVTNSTMATENPPLTTADHNNTHQHYIKFSKYCESARESRLEELRSKVRLPGLSALQERVLSLRDDSEEGNFKSLTDLPTTGVSKTNKPVAKSHSFKSIKSSSTFDAIAESQTTTAITAVKEDTIDAKEKVFSTKCEIKGSIFKAASLDSIKNLDDSCVTASQIKSREVIKQQPGSFKEKAEITITGPSHTAVVTVNNNSSNAIDSKITQKEEEKQVSTTVQRNSSEIVIKEQQVAITKVQVKRELTSTSASVVKNSVVPEFLNKPLNKIETKPASNVIFSTTSPRIIDEQSRPKSIFNFDTTTTINATTGAKDSALNLHRKFSKDDVEVIDKEIVEEIVEVPSKTPTTSSLVTVNSMATPTTARIFRKHSESQRKSSVASDTSVSAAKERPTLKIKSSSFEFVEPTKKSPEAVDASDKSSQDSLDNIDSNGGSKSTSSQDSVENVVYRKKSLAKHRNDDEPELMKVFARRSLKLKDSDMEAVGNQVDAMIQESAANDVGSKSRDSDKENHVDSPPEERRKSSFVKEIAKTTKESAVEGAENRKSALTTKPKEPLAETKFVETTEITLRKPTVINKPFAYQRALIMNISKPMEVANTELRVKKQGSFNDRPKTDSWLTNVKNQHQDTEKNNKEERITSHHQDMIAVINPNSDFVNEEELQAKPKNFNQRKAEWEKRAQDALKKKVP